jgi:CrcB protein
MAQGGSQWGAVLLVGLGGFVGAGSRYLVSGLVHRLVASEGFPWGTLAVNVGGCLLIGLLGGLMELRQALGPSMRLFLLIGVLGGFTTFSTLAYETLELAQAAQLLRAAGNLVAHLVLGLGAAWAGFVGARFL